ncbi:restriction endonuclease [Gordoniibacillus kamchatkensis]|uniref:restriction endonuclease n=1 Tax=Gordoniibacillus kamchatkensis TaxID=1590651 RepID=UPI0006987798|nr:restriction endonuclease [Paenibacillus sp. VKM B-2647]
MKLTDLVQDWGGFERLVADLHNTGNVLVQHNVTLIGRSGAPRQIDVLITHTEGLYTQQIIVECKYWKSKIKRTHIDAMITQMQDLNASKAVFFTLKGYQSGAETVASQFGIDIFIVREPDESEWGRPGPVVDFFLQVLSRTASRCTFPDATVYFLEGTDPSSSLNLNIEMGPRTARSSTITIKDDGTQGDTIEDLIDKGTQQAMEEFFAQNSFTLNNGEDCTRYLALPVVINVQPTVKVECGSAIIEIPQIQVELGIRIDQSRLIVDRRHNFFYALVVQDTVRNAKYYASRRRDASTSVIAEVSPEEATNEQVLINGSIFRVYTEHWFDPNEIIGLTTVDFEKVKQSRSE